MENQKAAFNFQNEVKGKYHTELADPPWRFTNRTGKVAPECQNCYRYPTLSLNEIKEIPIQNYLQEPAHLYPWVPNALLYEGLAGMKAWGFEYKTNIVWHKVRKDGGSDGSGVEFYCRNVTELVLFGIRGRSARTLNPGRTQVNFIANHKQGHSRKLDELYQIIESCSPGSYLELFTLIRYHKEAGLLWNHLGSKDLLRWDCGRFRNQSQR